MMNSEEHYTLRAELRGHDEDVRALLVCDLGLLTGSRDRTIKLWKETADGFQEEYAYVGHESYVTALQYIPAGLLADLPEGAIVSGSRDATVRLWNPATCQCIQTLTGHTYQVTDLAVGPDGAIVSASLDSTLRVWKDNRCAHTLEGHEGAVQCVVYLPTGEIVSGSNDTTIRMWREGKCIRTIQGHTDTVRGLALVPGLGFVSASHDQTLRVWTATGECLATLCGHQAIIYRAAASSSGLIASAAEDNTARVWQADGAALQSLEHPACVWDVAFLPNGDLVTACADYVARVWTASRERAAPSETVEAYQAAMAERKASAAAASGSSTQPVLPDGLKLEPETVLLHPGKKLGEMKVIREAGNGMVYTWNGQEWEKVGEVVGGPAQSDTLDVPSKWHNGEQYDFVVDVDFEEGVPPKKLAFNRSDNPYNVAERFLAEEGLPLTYRQQVVDYILNLMGRSSALPAAATSNVDPFTGSGAYVPGASAFPAPGTASHSSNPFISSGAYVPGSSAAPIVSMNGAESAKDLRHVPATSYIVYSSVPKLEAINSKLREFNSMLSASPENRSITLGEADVAPGGRLDILLARSMEATTTGASAQLSEEESATLQRLLSWPAAYLFPALDISRMLVLSPSNAEDLAKSAGTFELSNLGGIGGALARAASEPQLPGNLQTGLRLACNLFANPHTKKWIQEAYMSFVDAFSPAGSSSNKAVRSSWASLLVNISLMLSAPGAQTASASEGLAIVLSAVAELLSTCPEDDAETLARSLVAAGTIMHSSKETTSMVQDLGIIELAQRYRTSSNVRVAGIAKELCEL